MKEGVKSMIFILNLDPISLIFKENWLFNMLMNYLSIGRHHFVYECNIYVGMHLFVYIGF